MKHIKSLFLLFALCFTVGAYAQTNRIYIPDVKMSRGSESIISVFMDNAVEVTAVEFTLELPNGFTVNSASAILTERATNHQLTAKKLNNGKYKFVVMSPNNAPINGIAGRLFTVRMNSPEDVTDDGDYPMIITSAVMSAKHGQNVLEEANAGIITIESMPNLHVVSLECSDPVAGQTLTVKWKVRNDGRGSTGDAEWKDYIWLVPNISVGTSMIGSKMLASVDHISSLVPGELYESTANISLDERIYGNYDLLVTSNMYGATNIDYSKTDGVPPIPYQPETEEYGFLIAKGNSSYVTMYEENEMDGISDNFFYKRIDIQVPPLPDIQVPSVIVEVDTTGIGNEENGGLTTMTNFYSGKRVKVTATIANKGGCDIDSTTIKNILYISPSPDLTSNYRHLSSQDIKIALKAGETLTISFIVNVPEKWYGNTYFVVKADEEDAVYELGNTENNIGSSALVDVLVAPGADLVPYNLNVPSQISVGNYFSFAYSVRNDGAGLPAGYERRVYGTTPPDLEQHQWTDYVYLSTKKTGIDATAQCVGKVKRTGKYLPVYERYWVLVAPSSQNKSPKRVMPNIGLGHNDQIEITDNAIFVGQGNDARPTGYYQYVGDYYTETYDMQINNLQEGIYYMYVVVDADDNIYEYNGEDNNVIVSEPIYYGVPDVTVELLSLSEETLSTGSQIAVSWKIKNVGIIDISNLNTESQFFASTNMDGSKPIPLGRVVNTVSIAAGGEKVLRGVITIPSVQSLTGAYYIFVKTSIDGIHETVTSNNTSTGVVKQFEYVADPSERVNGTNLKVSVLPIESEVMPNTQVAVSYTIKNTGSYVIDRNVKQEVFISKKIYFDNSAHALDISGTLPIVAGINPGESVSATLSAVIPSDMMGGKNYIHVVINSDHALAEKRTDDNYANTSIYIKANLPDFVISDILIPETVMTSEETKISWKLTNNGTWDAEPTLCNVYISTDKEYSKDDKLLATVKSDHLAVNASENMDASFELEDDVVGSRYIIFQVNPNGAIEELNTTDNILFKPFTAKQSPLPDLAVSDLTYEGILRGGETITLNVKVKNVGNHETRKDKWTDVFYLSEGYTLDMSKAIRLGGKAHVGTLRKDSLYEVSIEANIPNDLNGYYVLFAVTDAANAIIENDKGNNQAKTTFYIADKNDTPADLIVKKVMAPSRITAGENISISYTLANNGEFAAHGKLRDVLYLSKDAKWDKNDVMVGVVTGEVDMEPGNELVRIVTGRITNMPEGSYYLILRTNSDHAIAETDYDNNLIVQTSSSTIEFTRLTLGSSTTVNTSGLFKLPMYSGLSGKTIGLYLTTDDNTSAGLYTAFESVPSTARYDRSASDLEKTEQEILIPDVQEGTYFILAQDNGAVSRSLNEFVIDGEQEPIETTMTLSAREVQFGATTLSIKEGGTNGWISTEIHGALLDSIMDFRLAREGEIIPAEVITFYDQTSSRATFNLNDAETGSYDFISELPDGTQATIPEGFKVVPGSNVALGIKFDAPKATRIDGYAPVNVTYVNGGNTDIVIRELLLTIRGGELSTTIEGFRSDPQKELHIRPEGKQDIRGYVVIPPGKQETVNYYFRQTSLSTQLNLYIVK